MIWTFNRNSFLGTAALMATLLAAPAFGAPIGIVNGDFELDAADDVAPPTGWTDLSSATSFWTGVPDETGNPTAAEAALAPAPGLGDYFLTTARQSTDPPTDSQPTDGLLEQTVDLSAFGSLIDLGFQQLLVDFIWASDDNRDTGTVDLSFYSSPDGSGTALGSGYSVPLDDGDGFSFTGWIPETVGGLVPVSARSATIAIATTRSGGSETNLWLDNFTGQIVPEPTALTLLTLGTLTLVCGRRRS